MKSSMAFLDWGSPQTLKDRANAYLKDGYPLEVPLSTNMARLRALKTVRNHIAHMSEESTVGFQKVVRSHFGTVPLKLPGPGEFLLLPCRHDPTTYYLKSFMETMEEVQDKNEESVIAGFE